MSETQQQQARVSLRRLLEFLSQHGLPIERGGFCAKLVEPNS